MKINIYFKCEGREIIPALAGFAIGRVGLVE